MREFEPLINNFTGGEISPKLDPRSDLQKYYSSCRVLENMIPMVEGGVTSRPGTYFVAEAKDSSKIVRLFSFQFSTVQSYIIEAGEEYFRFYKDNAQILSGGSAYEIATPYQEDELRDLKVCQSADILYIVHRDHCPRKLTRTGHTSWTLEKLIATTGGWFTITGVTQANPAVVTCKYGLDDDYPSYDFEELKGETVYFKDIAGMTELNDNFYAISKTELITNKADRDFSAASNWTNNDLSYYDESGDLSIADSADNNYCYLADTYAPMTIGKRYELKFKSRNVEETWQVKSYDGTQLYGSFSADGNQRFTFTAQTTGGIRIVTTDYGRPSADLDDFSLTDLEEFILTGIDSSAYSAYTSGGTAVTTQFGLTGDNPCAVAFFEQRLMMAGTDNDPLDVFGSASSDFENFLQDAEDASSAIQYSLLSDKVDAIRWLLGEEYLMIGTMGSIWKLGASSTTEALSMDNVNARRQASIGVKDMDAEMLQSSVVYVQRGGTTVRRLEWDYYADKYQQQNINRIAGHITKGSTAALSGIVDMDYQSEPMSILWAIRADGVLLGMTYEPAENIMAWFRTVTDGTFESVAVTSNEGDEDRIWVAVNRTIGGATKRCIEYFMPHEFFGVLKDAFFVDSGLTYSGSAVSTVTGLTHLIGETVSVLTAEGVHPNCVVSATGSISLDWSSTKITAGLPYTYSVQPMKLEPGTSKGGSSRGKKKRVYSASAAFYQTYRAKWGPDVDNLEDIPFGTGVTPTLFTGDKETDFDMDYETGASVYIQGQSPLPMTVLSIAPNMVGE